MRCFLQILSNSHPHEEVSKTPRGAKNSWKLIIREQVFEQYTYTLPLLTFCCAVTKIHLRLQICQNTFKELCSGRSAVQWELVLLRACCPYGTCAYGTRTYYCVVSLSGWLTIHSKGRKHLQFQKVMSGKKQLSLTPYEQQHNRWHGSYWNPGKWSQPSWSCWFSARLGKLLGMDITRKGSWWVELLR